MYEDLVWRLRQLWKAKDVLDEVCGIDGRQEEYFKALGNGISRQRQ